MEKRRKKKSDEGYIINLNRCNQRCLFCLKKDDIASYENIAREDVIAEIELAKHNDFERIYFFGGEPTVFEFLPEVIAHAVSLGMRTFLATNGTKFSSLSYTESFFNKVDKAAIEIRISLHSHLPEIHDRITRVKGSHVKTLSGVSRIVKHVKPSVTVVVTSLNYDHLDKIVESLYSMGVSTVKFAFLVMTGEVVNNKWLTVKPVDYIRPLLRAINLARKLNFVYIGVENFPRKLFTVMMDAKIPVKFNESEYDDVLDEMEVERKKMLNSVKPASKGRLK